MARDVEIFLLNHITRTLQAWPIQVSILVVVAVLHVMRAILPLQVLRVDISGKSTLVMSNCERSQHICLYILVFFQLVLGLAKYRFRKQLLLKKNL